MEHGELEGQISALWPRRHRQLVQSHFYRVAVKMFGPPKSRIRVMTAVPSPTRHPPRSWPGSLPRPQPAEEERRPDQEPDVGYALWLAKKRQQRAELEAVADVKSWVNSKIAATDLELRVLERLERRSRRGDPEPEAEPEPEHQPKTQKKTSHKLYDKTLSINLPSLEPIKLLHEYLYKKRLRLVDFFRNSDRGMKGKLSKDDLLVAFEKVNLPITDLQINTLTETLGDHTKCIRYKVLAQALNTWKEELRHENRNDHFEKVNGLPEIAVSTKRPNTTASVEQDGHVVSRSPHYLKVPTPNLRESRPFTAGELEQLEMRDHDRNRMLKNKLHHTDLMEKCLHVRGVEYSIACHSLPTTVGEATNTFRQQCLMEYRKILKLCKFYGIAFTEKMLVKALLHPGDKLKKDLGQNMKLRQPGTGVLSDNNVKQWYSTRQLIVMDQLNSEYAQGNGETQIKVELGKNQLKKASDEPESKLRYPQQLIVDNLNQESKHGKGRVPIELGPDNSQLKEASEEAGSKLRQLTILDKVNREPISRRGKIQIKSELDNGQPKMSEKSESKLRISPHRSSRRRHPSVSLSTSSKKQHMTLEDYMKFKRCCLAC